MLWYSFTSYNNFLLTLSHSLSEKQEKPSPSTSRHIMKSLSVYLFFNSGLWLGKSKNFNNDGNIAHVKKECVA